MTTLPEDLFTVDASQDPAQVFLELAATDADTRAKRTDMIGVIALEEQAEGKGGWRERVQLRLTADGHEPIGTKVISDATKIFRLFRLVGEGSLGWTREQMGQHQPGRLRVFAQNADWAAKHLDRVAEMLASGRNEGAMREVIREAKAAEREERPEKPKAEWTTLSVRVDPEYADLLSAILQAVRVKSEQAGENFSEKPAVAHGQVIFALAAEWLHRGETFLQNGQEVVVSNRAYLDPETRAQVEAALAEDAEDAEHADQRVA